MRHLQGQNLRRTLRTRGPHGRDVGSGAEAAGSCAADVVIYWLQESAVGRATKQLRTKLPAPAVDQIVYHRRAVWTLVRIRKQAPLARNSCASRDDTQGGQIAAAQTQIEIGPVHRRRLQLSRITVQNSSATRPGWRRHVSLWGRPAVSPLQGRAVVAEHVEHGPAHVFVTEAHRHGISFPAAGFTTSAADMDEDESEQRPARPDQKAGGAER